MPKYRFAIVVGASSGIGAEIVRLLAKEGCKVAAIARREDKLKKLAAEFPGLVIPVAHDVTCFDEVPGVFQSVTGQLGGLDLIVYASGVMPAVSGAEFDFAKDRQMIEVNVLGAIAWLNQAAIRFQNTKCGSIVAIGSVAGDRGRCGQPVYNTSKAALTTYMEALRNRVARFGVKVVTIKPGPTATEMTSHMHSSGMASAAAVASFVLRKSDKTGEHYVKFGHRIAFFIIRHFPSWLFRRLNV
ncbi:MAG: SDR family NAD(P)-dependent oxidoreductase [Fimbriimonas sp.]|nr:SDR family NAD(P)-dependent oxidoreductase [Fimbriimonas sp.]